MTFQLCAIAMMLLASVSVVGQVSSSRESAQQPKLGSIRGRVVNESGQPLANASVSLGRFDSPQSEQTVFTDREGKFELTGLAPARYRIVARLRAYAPALRDPSQPSENFYRVGDSVTMVLVKGGVITGAVTNQAGEPVVGVRVRAEMTRDAHRLPWPYVLFLPDRTTDDRGVYRIYGLPAGTYVVSAGGPSGWYSRVDAFDTDAPTYFPAATRDTAEAVTVRAGEEATNIDIHYRGEPGRKVSGRVITGADAGEATGAAVRLRSAVDIGLQTGMSTGQPSGSEGFVFKGVGDGDYDVRALLYRPNGEYSMSATKRITVRGADVTGIELVTQPLSAVSGRVVLEESKATECADKQRPLFSETLVRADPRENESDKENLPFVSIGGRSAATDAEGNVSLKNLPPGRYQFVPQFFAKSWYLQSILLTASATTAVKTSRSIDAANTWTALKSGDRLSGLTITLAHGAASLEGQLALKEGEVRPEKSFVYLVPAEREKAGDVLRFFGTTVSSDGKIALSNIAPGRYLVLVQPALDGSSLAKLRSPDEKATRAKLRREAEAAKTEIELKPCQDLVDFRFH
jgi:protocatechuate 3,4-dioxygenase beta subunit